MNKLRRIISKRNPSIHKLSSVALDKHLFTLSEREVVLISKNLFARSRDKRIHLTLLDHLTRLSKGNSLASKLIEGVAVSNPNPSVRLKAIIRLPYLAKNGFLISLSSLRKMRLEKNHRARAFALSIALEMARKGNQGVLPEFLYSIRNEKSTKAWEIAEDGLFELAQKGNKTAQIEIDKIQKGVYKHSLQKKV